MKECANDIVAFGMNDTELRVVASVAFVFVVVYLYKLILKTSKEQ